LLFSHWWIRHGESNLIRGFSIFDGPQYSAKECSTRASRSWSLLSFFTSEEAEPEEAQDVFSTSPELVAWSLMQIFRPFGHRLLTNEFDSTLWMRDLSEWEVPNAM
jgi:hypothetical protein